MNPNNYASLEASRRLIEAGIVLETDFYHYVPYPKQYPDKSEIISKKDISPLKPIQGVEFYPAPSMAEAWRELP